MHKRHFLVTAGTTREPIDHVRDWGNVFTGKTGLDIALGLLHQGDVTLLTSNTTHAREFSHSIGPTGGLHMRTFRRHSELHEMLQEALAQQPIDGVFMTAAVSDYAPRGVYRVLDVKDLPGQAGSPPRQTWLVEPVEMPKVPGNFARMAVLGEPTEKLVDLFRGEWQYRGLLVKFKLEAGITEEQLLAVAEQSRLHSGAEYIVANTLDMVRGPEPAAYIIGQGQVVRVPRAALAAALANLAQVWLQQAAPAAAQQGL